MQEAAQENAEREYQDARIKYWTAQNGTTYSPEEVEQYRVKYEAAKAKVDNTKVDSVGLGQRYFELNSKQQLDELSKDQRLQGIYQGARRAEADMQKVQNIMHYRHDPTSNNAETAPQDIAYLQQKYGLDKNLTEDQLYDYLVRIVTNAENTLKDAGYKYDSLAHYEDSMVRNAESEKLSEEMKAFAKEKPGRATAYSVFASPFRGGEGLRALLRGQGSTDDLENYMPVYTNDMPFTQSVGDIRETVMNEHIDSGVGRAAYQLGTSVADSWMGAIMSGGVSGVGSLILASGAASDATNDALERGANRDQAFLMGTAVGAAEYLFEKLGFDELFGHANGRGAKAFFTDTLRQFGVEGVGEGLTEVANIISDATIMQGKSNTQELIRQFKENGATQAEAEKRAFLENVKQVAAATLMGGISGAAMNVAYAPFNRNADFDLLDGLVQPQTQQNTLPVETDLDRAMMETIGQNNTDISLDMPEAQRYERLTTKTITVTKKDASTTNAELQGNIESIKTSAAKAARNTIVEIARKIGLLNKPLTTPTIDFEFDFSKRNGLRESLTKQMRYGGNYASMAGAVANLETILKNAVLIEQHTDKYKGTIRENPHLLRTCVLLGVYEDGTDIIPVQFEIKETDDTGGHLYIVVSLTKIEAGVFGSTQSNNSTARGLLPASTYSLSDIFANVNVADKHFLKYVPDGFLSEEQKMAKQEALEEDRIRISKIPKKEATPAKEPVNGNNLQNPAEGFVGAYSGMTYNAEQAALLAAVSTEGIQVAEELATRQDVTFNNIGINDKETQQKWLDAGLAYVEQNADGDSFLVVNAAMLLDERARRANAQKKNNQENDLSFLLDNESERFEPNASDADVLATDLAQQLKDGKTVSNSDIGRLYSFMLTEANANRFVDSFDLLDGIVQPQVQQNAQASGRTMMEMMGQKKDLRNKNAVATVLETSYIDTNGTGGDINGGEEVHLHNGSQRTDGAHPGRTISAMEESSGEHQSRNAESIGADRETVALTYGEEAVSPAALGIQGGSENKTIRLVTGGDTTATREAKRIAQQNGLELILFACDNLHMRERGTDVSARAYIIGNKAYVRVDHPEFTSAQLMGHEEGHNKIRKGMINPAAVRGRIAKIMGKRNARAACRMYAQAYEGSGLTAEEIWEEIICDANGNMNIFTETMNETQAGEYLEQVRSAVDAETAKGRAPPASNTNTVGKMSREYWRTDLTKTQYLALMNWVKRDIETSTNSVCEVANWTYHEFREFGGLPVFAIYSTGNQSEPTILYEVKGEQAKFERGYLEIYLEELNYGRNIDQESEAINEVLGGSWVRHTGRTSDRNRTVGRGRSSGDAGVLQKSSRRKPRAAFESVLRNLLQNSENGRGRGSVTDQGALAEGKMSRELSYSGKNVEWAVERGVITEADRIAFFRMIANINKLGDKVRRTSYGGYIVELHNKLLFTDGDWHSPTLSAVVTFFDNSETSMSIAKEVIFNGKHDEAGYEQARQIIESAYWPGYVERYTERDRSSYGRENAGGEGSNGRRDYGEVWDKVTEGEGDYSPDYAHWRNLLKDDNSHTSRELESIEKLRKQGAYEYRTLTAKPDMKVTAIDETVRYPANKETRESIVKEALKNAAVIGKTNERGEVSVYVDDIGIDVVLSKKGLKHGLDRRLQDHAAVTIKAGEILKNSIRINELSPKIKEAATSYVLFGAAKNSKDEPILVEFVVNSFDNSVETVNVLKSLNAKREPAVRNAPKLTENPLLVTDSTISIADILEIARRNFPDVLPESVLRHFGIEARPEGELGESALYSRELPLIDRMREEYRALVGQTGSANSLSETAVGATRYDPNSWSTFQNEAEGGYHPEGANAARPTDVPKRGRDGRNISRVANNAMGAQMVPDRAVSDLEQQLKDGKTVSNSDIGRLYSFMLTEANANKFVDSFDLLDGLVPQAKQNASPANMAMDEAESTVINTDPAKHTPEEQAIIDEYQQAVNPEIVKFVDRWKTLKNPDYKKKVKMTVANITSKAIADVRKLIGLDVSGYKHIINGNSLYHIEKRHGKNGKHDHSMSDVNDIARIGYVLENYDTVDISYDKNDKIITSGYISNADGTPAVHIVFKKKVNGTYYVIEAAPDSAAKNLVVTSAYMQKGSTDQVLNMPQATSSHTPEAPHGANTPSNNVSQPTQPVNGNNSQNNQENDLSFLLDNESERFEPEMGDGSQQRFKADVSKYENEYAKKTIQNLMDSGLANNSNEFHAFADWLAKISADKGIVFNLTDTGRLQGTRHDLEGKFVDGFIDENGNITLNIDSQKAGQIIVGHEITHVLEGTKFYAELQSAIKNYAISKMGLDAFNAKLRDIEGRYKGIGDPDKEITADLIGELLFTDADFIKNLSVQHRNVFQRIWDEIKYLCKVVTAGSKEARQLEKVKKLFEDAYRADSKAHTDTKYSLTGKNQNGIEVYETSQDIMKLTWDERKAKYLDVMKNEYCGRTAKFERNGHIYYATFDQSSIRKPIYGDKRSSKSGVKALIKAGADGDVFDLVENSLYTGSKKNTKNHTNADYFDYFVKTVQIDGKVFDLVADIEKKYRTDGGYMYTLALVDNKKIKASPALGTPNTGPVKSAGNASNNKIAQSAPPVKEQNSLSTPDSKQHLVSSTEETGDHNFLSMRRYKFHDGTSPENSIRQSEQNSDSNDTQRQEAPETAVGATRYDPDSWSTFQNEAEGGYHPEGANAARPTDVPKKGRDGRNISRVANPKMSQIYHWGKKENATLGGGKLGKNTASPGASSDASSNDRVSQSAQSVNGNNSQNNQKNDLSFLLDNESERFEPETDSVGYKAYYEAGLSGAPMESVTNIRGSELTQEQKQAAYERGQREAAESLVRETANARFTPSYGNNAHLVDNEYSKKLSKQTRDTLNDLARMTGVNIEVADMEDGINGSYDPKTGTMKINAKVKNAALVVAAHEVTHRMQQAAPQEYRQYRDYVVNAISQKIGRSALEYTMERYARQGIELTTEEAMDELASDFAMDMVRDGKLFQDLMQKHRNAAQVLLDSVKSFLSKVKNLFWHSYAVQNSVTHDHFGVEMETLENAVRMWETAMNSTRQQVEGKEIAAQTDGNVWGKERHSIGPIIDQNGKSYGMGVHLDSTLLTNLTEDERKDMVKERIKELGGKSFTAYDNNGNAIDITVARAKDVFWNKNGKKKPVNKDLTTKHIGNTIKQETVVLVDELIETAKFQTSNPAKYPHGWLDDQGKNKWDVWETYVQDKNKTIWKATLHVANSSNGQKIIYDIDPIKMVGRPGKSGATPTTHSISQTNQKSNSQNNSSNGQNSVTESVTNIRGSELTQEQKQAAYERGQREAAESLVRETANARFTPSYGNNAHLVDNEYSKKLSKQTRDTLNDLARMTGVNIEVADMEDGINGSYDPKTGTMKINAKVKNAALVVAAHEVTHRMQQAAPQEYRQYRDYVVNAISQKIGRSALEYTMERYARQGIELTTEEAMDELASDFAMDMVRDGKLFQDLMQKHRNAAQVLLDSVKSFLSKVKNLFWHSYAVQNSVTHDHFGVEMETLENAVRMWENAMTATRQQVEGKEIAAQTDGGEKRFALAGWTKDGRRVYETGFDSSIPEKQRIELFKERIATVFNLGAVNLKTDTKKILINGDKITGRKNVYGDDTRSKKTGEFSAKINALYDMADILTGAKFVPPANVEESYANPNISPKNKAHKGVKYWYKFRTYIVMDGIGYEVTFNIRDKGKEQYQYLIEFKEDGTPAVNNTISKRNLLSSTTDVPNSSIRQTSPKSKKQNSVTETETFRADRAKELMDKYGTIYPGENPHRKASVPRNTSGKEFVSQTIRTVIEAKATPDAAVPTLEELAADGEFSYERYTDQQAMDDARDTITHLGYQGALTSWTNAVERGKVSKKNTALGWELYRQAANANDMESAVTILNLMVEHQRNAAQALQATRILKKMDPDAQLYGVQKSVSRLQEELKAKFKDKAPELKISTALAEQFLNAETDEARAKVLNAMYADIGRQIPATFKEKWDNWRYLAMLANPRTHIRNFFGNAAFVPVRGIGNQLSALGQLTLPKEQRTRSLGFNISAERRALVDAAKNDFETNTGELVMSGDKYNSATNIMMIIATSVRFYLYGKNACSISHTCGIDEIVSQQSELCVFRAQLQLRTFYFIN